MAPPKEQPNDSFAHLWHAAHHPPVDPTHLSFKDKTVLVTGANTGLGYEAALKFAAQGASPLILACRTLEKGEAAKASILQKTNRAAENILVKVVDFSTFAATKAFAEEIKTLVPLLHVVVCNAGLAYPSFVSGPEGYDYSLQVIVLSTALLSILLLPKLQDTGTTDPSFTPHLTLVNSRASRTVKPENVPTAGSGQTLIGRLNDRSAYTARTQYDLTKLASFYIMQGLIERSRTNEHSGNIVINVNCPGLCKTELARNYGLVGRVIQQIFYFFLARTAEQGARTLVSATGQGPESTGKMWMDDHCVEPTAFQSSDQSAELQRETWREILTILREHIDTI